MPSWWERGKIIPWSQVWWGVGFLQHGDVLTQCLSNALYDQLCSHGEADTRWPPITLEYTFHRCLAGTMLKRRTSDFKQKNNRQTNKCLDSGEKIYSLNRTRTGNELHYAMSSVSQGQWSIKKKSNCLFVILSYFCCLIKPFLQVCWNNLQKKMLHKINERHA